MRSVFLPSNAVSVPTGSRLATLSAITRRFTRSLSEGASGARFAESTVVGSDFADAAIAAGVALTGAVLGSVAAAGGAAIGAAVVPAGVVTTSARRTG